MAATFDCPDESGPDGDLPAGVTRRPTRLSELVDTRSMDDADCAATLLALADARARLAAFEADVVTRLADLRPDLWDLNPDDPAARVEGWGSARTFNGVTEFFTDELATVLGISRTRADTLANTSLVLREQLIATWEALADGRIDLPRAQALVTALGWQAPTVDPEVVAAVEREALQWAIAGEGPYALRNRAAALLLQHDAEAADRRRKEAVRNTDVTVRNPADGMADLVVRMPAEVAAAAFDTCDTYARMRKAAGDDRPIGHVRALVAADLLLRPWDTSREPVTAHLTLFAPLPSTAVPGAASRPAGDDRDLAPVTVAEKQPGPEGGRIGPQPITAAHLREVLTQLGFCTAAGLAVPAGSSVDLALTDPRTGALRAVLTPHQLRLLAARGCRAHPDRSPGHRRQHDGRRADDPGGHAGDDQHGDRGAHSENEGASVPPPAAVDGTRPLPSCSCPVLDAPPPTDTHRPTAAQRRFIDARDRTCRHPGCARPARWTDADHVVSRHEGGRTDCANLCNLCRRHHRLKTHAPGWVYSMTPDGRLSVTTPSGVTRTNAPPATHHRLRPDDLLHPLETGRPVLSAASRSPDPTEDPPPF